MEPASAASGEPFFDGDRVGHLAIQHALSKLSRTAIAFACAMGFATPLAADPLLISPRVVQESEGAVTQAALTAPEAVAPAPRRPTKDVHYNVVVFGDSLGDGVWAGLYHVLRKDKRFSVIRRSRVATGFARKDYFDWNDAVREATGELTVDIAVVVMGTNDRQTIVENGKRLNLFDPAWRDVYDARVDDFTQTLKEAGARVYWVGLPVMRSARFERDMATFSDIFEARAVANGISFVPTHDVAADRDGHYQAYGLDGAGRKRLLRTEDGMHFTMDGYLLLARRIGGVVLADVDGGTLTAKAASGIAGSSAATDGGGTSTPGPVASIDLKAPVYDLPEIRPGRSDDWRWTGAAVR